MASNCKNTKVYGTHEKEWKLRQQLGTDTIARQAHQEGRKS